MKQTLSTWEAAKMLVADEYANWTMDGAIALVEHLEELEADLGHDIEFDKVALRCDWHEYETPLAAVRDLCPDWGGDGDKDALEWLNFHTVVIPVGSRVVVNLF